MRIRTAILTGVTGLMLNVGMGQEASAQPNYRYGYGSERSLASSRQARQLVRQAYRDILRREPDPAGLRQYTDAMVRGGWSVADVRRSLVSSREYRQRFGRGGRDFRRR